MMERKGAAPPVMDEGAAEGVSYEAARSGLDGHDPGDRVVRSVGC